MLTIKQLVEMYRKELNSIINCEKNFFISKDVGVDGKVLKAMSSHGLVEKRGRDRRHVAWYISTSRKDFFRKILEDQQK